MEALAPPPSDMALRVAMFKSWGVPPPTAIAATSMNALSFFVARFSAPLLGFFLVAVPGDCTDFASWILRALELRQHF